MGLYPIKESSASYNNGTSVFGGINYDNYPVHRHRYIIPSQFGKLPVHLHTIGESDWRRGASRWRKNSNIFSVELVTDGTFEFIQDSVRNEVASGQMFLVRKDCDLSMTCLTRFASKMTAVIDGKLLPALLVSLNLSDKNVIYPSDSEAVKDVLRRAMELDDKGNPETFEMNSSMLCIELLFMLGREAKTENIPDNIKAIARYLENNLSERISMKEVAARFGMSPASMFRRFHEELHETPGQFLIRKRMEAAKLLLLRNEDSIKDIAFKTGYSSPLYFSTEFSRYVGVSPRRFKYSGHPAEND